MNELTKKRMKEWADSCETESFAANDPVRIPRGFTLLQDIEIAAFVTSWLDYGKRDDVTRATLNVIRCMGKSPYRYIMNREYAGCKEEYFQLHSFITWNDLFYVCDALNNLYTAYDSMEDYLLASVRDKDPDSPDLYLTPLVDLFEGCYGVPMSTVSACYRLCLFLRWMVRTDSRVDLGVWKRLSPARLVMPLNARAFHTARELGLVTRMSRDMKAALQLTQEMRKAFGTDPLRGCFALEGYEAEKEGLRKAI